MLSVECECGCVVGKYYLSRHKQTHKHFKRMYSIRPREPTMVDLMKQLEALEEKVDIIGSGEYLRECNRLKSIYDKLKRSEYISRIMI